MFQEIKDPKHPLHYLLPPVKLSNSQMVMDVISSHTAYQRSFRLDLILLLLVLLVLLVLLYSISIITVYVCVHVCMF